MFVLNQENSIANHFIAEMRDKQIQKDSLRFRKNLERLGEVLAYEISKTLDYKKKIVDTPLGESQTQVLAQQPVLATILRAGLPLFQGFLNFFDKAESAFVGAYRSPHTEDNSFDIIQGYTATPNLDDKTLILIDPMLATGRSIVAVYESLLIHGKPSKVVIASLIASEAGATFVQNKIKDVQLFIGAVDKELNDKAYIVPGLGDAGDLAFGNKE